MTGSLLLHGKIYIVINKLTLGFPNAVINNNYKHFLLVLIYLNS